MNDDEDTIRDLLAWAKKQPKGPVRSMANVLAKQIKLLGELPEKDMWGRDQREIVREVIRKTIEHLKSKIDANARQ